MSSENLSRSIAAENSAVAARHQQFCADMADGLHALAQPLSVLRSAVEMLAHGEIAAGNHQRYIDLSVDGVRRTCDLFGRLQELLLTEIQEPALTALDLREVVAAVVEERTADLAALGIGISASVPEELGTVLGDAGRMEQAILAGVDAAASVGNRGDVLEIAVTSSAGFIECTLGNSRSHGRTLNAASRLQLSLARAHVVSQHGRCTLTENPLCISFAIPLSEDGQNDRAA